MARGMVGVWGRATKTVAPNSPRLMVKAKTAATTSARPKIGKSTVRHTFQGPAPSTAADSRSFGGMLRRAGSKLRTTKGKATRVWARGTSIGDVRRLSGGLSKARIKPNPRVTAEVDSGSMNKGSSTDRKRFAGPAKNTAAGTPRLSAIKRAARENPRE